MNERTSRQELLSRISIDKNVCFGKPCIRGHRIRVSLVLDLLASGWTVRELLDQYPGIEEADVLACIAYGSGNVPRTLRRRVPPRAARQAALGRFARRDAARPVIVVASSVRIDHFNGAVTRETEILDTLRLMQLVETGCLHFRRRQVSNRFGSIHPSDARCASNVLSTPCSHRSSLSAIWYPPCFRNSHFQTIATLHPASIR